MLAAAIARGSVLGAKHAEGLAVARPRQWQVPDFEVQVAHVVERLTVRSPVSSLLRRSSLPRSSDVPRRNRPGSTRPFRALRGRCTIRSWSPISDTTQGPVRGASERRRSRPESTRASLPRGAPSRTGRPDELDAEVGTRASTSTSRSRPSLTWPCADQNHQRATARRKAGSAYRAPGTRRAPPAGCRAPAPAREPVGLSRPVQLLSAVSASLARRGLPTVDRARLAARRQPLEGVLAHGLQHLVPGLAIRRLLLAQQAVLHQRFDTVQHVDCQRR